LFVAKIGFFDHSYSQKDGIVAARRRFYMQELLVRCWHTRTNLRIDMQFELKITGKERLGVEHHSNRVYDGML